MSEHSKNDRFMAACHAMHFFCSEEALRQLEKAVAEEHADRPEDDRRHISNQIIAKRSVWLADALLRELANE